MKDNENIMIIGEKVVFVPYKKYHVLKYHSWMTNDVLLQATASEPLSLEDEYKMQQSWLMDSDKCTFIILAKDLFLNSTGSMLDQSLEEKCMIGDVNLFFNDKDNMRQAEIEIMIAEDSFRGLGLGKESVCIMLFYGYNQLDCNEFLVKISDDNVKSLGLFKKLGFSEISYSSVFKESTLKLQCDEEFKANIVDTVARTVKICEHNRTN